MKPTPPVSSAQRAILALCDGSVYEGSQFGAVAESVGELVFSTAMTGYPEAVTDPSYAGQILAFSYPLVGNYGISGEWLESAKPHLRAVVAREVSSFSCHPKSTQGFGEFLSSHGIPGICGVDTRDIVLRVREKGVMPAAVMPLQPSESAAEAASRALEKIRSYDYGGINFVGQVSCKERSLREPEGWSKKVALINCGVKESIVRQLLARNVAVELFPFDASGEDILKSEPDGLLVSNGPGDPALLAPTISTVRGLLKKMPVFGICLGHQLLAHALGASTYKLKFGHRGANHAVRNLETGRIFITSQNHGYAVKDLPQGVKPTFEDCNDGTNEGLRHCELPVFSCQFHPEGSCGPADANYLFDDFVKML
ncbi:MAG: glutamine-hydrolyzing carbamoyl-phosphate synthase small subunit [Candidatus Micrarchaeota archaeon]